MKFSCINEEKTLEELDAIASNSICFYTYSAISAYENDPVSHGESYSNKTTIHFPRIRIREDKINNSAKRLGTNLKKLNNYKKIFNYEYTKITGLKKYDLGLKKVFYGVNSTILLETIYLPMIKDFNNASHQIIINNQFYKVYLDNTSSYYPEETSIEIRLEIKDYPEDKTIISEEEQSNIYSQLDQLKREIQNVYTTKLSTFIMIFNQIVNGEIPVLQREVGLEVEETNEIIYSLKLNIFVDRAEYSITDNLHNDNVNEYVNEQIENIIDKFSHLKNINTISELKNVFERLNYKSIGRDAYTGAINTIIRTNRPDIFIIDDEDAFIEIEPGNFSFSGKLSKETYLSLKDKVIKLKGSNTAHKLLACSNFI